jgi:hypothetical protein
MKRNFNNVKTFFLLYISCTFSDNQMLGARLLFGAGRGKCVCVQIVHQEKV